MQPLAVDKYTVSSSQMNIFSINKIIHYAFQHQIEFKIRMEVTANGILVLVCQFPDSGIKREVGDRIRQNFR